jgi:hypothetical protein
MKREILNYKSDVCGCCPGHDDYPNESYKNRRSKHARSRDKKIEHQHARSIASQQLKQELSKM